jgi:hypothetical protein
MTHLGGCLALSFCSPPPPAPTLLFYSINGTVGDFDEVVVGTDD